MFLNPISLLIPPGTSLASGAGSILLSISTPTAGLPGHADPVAPILLVLVLIAIGAALGGKAMRWVGQPAVLGELLVGYIFCFLSAQARHHP
jgi:hypothetical protein